VPARSVWSCETASSIELSENSGNGWPRCRQIESNVFGPTSGSSGRYVGGMALASGKGKRPAASARRSATPLCLRIFLAGQGAWSRTLSAGVQTVLLRMFIVVVGIPLLTLSTGCDTSEPEPPAEEFLAYALALQVPDSVDAADSIDAVVSGFAGCCCDRFARVESEMVGSTWILRPIGIQGKRSAGTYCVAWLVHFEASIALKAPGTGWAYIEVQSAGPTLLDSCYVRE
jgi:hypothetical protein